LAGRGSVYSGWGAHDPLQEASMKRIISGLAIASLVLSTAALADKATTKKELTEDEVKTKVEAAGYTDVKDIHKEGMHYDATATKGGQEVTLDVDAKTGAIKPEKDKDSMPGK